MMKVVQGTFQQIPYWKLRGRFHSCGFRGQEIANAIGIGNDTIPRIKQQCRNVIGYGVEVKIIDL